jgi:hypothetical protein
MAAEAVPYLLGWHLVWQFHLVNNGRFISSLECRKCDVSCYPKTSISPAAIINVTWQCILHTNRTQGIRMRIVQYRYWWSDSNLFRLEENVKWKLESGEWQHSVAHWLAFRKACLKRQSREILPFSFYHTFFPEPLFHTLQPFFKLLS